MRPISRRPAAEPQPTGFDASSSATTAARTIVRSARPPHLLELELLENRIIHFPIGLIGYPDVTRFTLDELRAGSAIRWLRAVDDDAIALAVLHVAALRIAFPVDDVRRGLEFCDIERDEDVAVLVICRVPRSPEAICVNLRAPIGIGVRSGRGAQVMLRETELALDTPIASLM